VSRSSSSPAARRRPPGRTSPQSSTTTPRKVAPGESGSPADGTRIARLATADTTPAADDSAQATASELVLAFYNRIPLDALKLDGDRQIFDQLVAWEPQVVHMGRSLPAVMRWSG